MILQARKSERRRKQRKRLIALQGNEYERQKALKQMPKHIRDALNVRDENEVRLRIEISFPRARAKEGVYPPHDPD